LPLTGNRTLLQQSVDRLASLCLPAQTMVVCGPAHAVAIARQLPDVPESNLVVEPFPRGSGPAIGLAAALIARRDPHAIMGSFAADHDITNLDAFSDAVKTAIMTARQGWLCTIGLTPTRPETGYGYIERSGDIVVERESGVSYRALRFVEKPDLETATSYVRSGRFLWNASMFIWSVRTFMDELAHLMPELHAALQRICDIWDKPNRDQLMSEIWQDLDESTIDQGIMERSDKVAVVPAEMGWSDVGDWNGLGELIAQDDGGNSVKGDLVQIESRKCVVWSDTGRLVALIGQENTVVVDTPDALLVINRERAQDVKKIVEELKRQHRAEVH
jgi:mannose-1-phosphate guanylyltransferase